MGRGQWVGMVCVQVCGCVRMYEATDCVHVYTHTHTHMHTYTHTYTHIVPHRAYYTEIKNYTAIRQLIHGDH